MGMPLASWGSRFGAWLIDGLVLLVPAVILFFLVVAGAVGISGNDDDVTAGAVIGAIVLWFLLMVAVSLLYAPLLMARQGLADRPWESSLLGIRVVRDTGQTMGFGWAALREIAVRHSPWASSRRLSPSSPGCSTISGRSGMTGISCAARHGGGHARRTGVADSGGRGAHFGGGAGPESSRLGPGRLPPSRSGCRSR